MFQFIYGTNPYLNWLKEKVNHVKNNLKKKHREAITVPIPFGVDCINLDIISDNQK